MAIAIVWVLFILFKNHHATAGSLISLIKGRTLGETVSLSAHTDGPQFPSSKKLPPAGVPMKSLLLCGPSSITLGSRSSSRSSSSGSNRSHKSSFSYTFWTVSLHTLKLEGSSKSFSFAITLSMVPINPQSLVSTDDPVQVSQPLKLTTLYKIPHQDTPALIPWRNAELYKSEVKSNWWDRNYLYTTLMDRKSRDVLKLNWMKAF